MSTLSERLERIKASFLKQAAPEAVEVMGRATEQLRASGILSRLPAVGSPIPDFSLEDTEGECLQSEELLQKGPLILTFYRGVW